MDKQSSSKPPKPTIGSKLQNNPFLANSQSSSQPNPANQKAAPVKKKTTAPAWLQKQEFASSKRASLQKMSQKVSSNPWKSGSKSNLPTASAKKPPSSLSKLPTPTTNSISNTTKSSSKPSVAKESPSPTQRQQETPTKPADQKPETTPSKDEKDPPRALSTSMEQQTTDTIPPASPAFPAMMDEQVTPALSTPMEQQTIDTIPPAPPAMTDEQVTPAPPTMTDQQTIDTIPPAPSAMTDEQVTPALSASMEQQTTDTIPPAPSAMTDEQVTPAPPTMTDQQVTPAPLSGTDEPIMQTSAGADTVTQAALGIEKLSIDTSNVSHSHEQHSPSNERPVTADNHQPLNIESPPSSPAIPLQTTELVSSSVSLNNINKKDSSVSPLYQHQHQPQQNGAITSTNSLFDITLPWSQHTQEQQQQQNAIVTTDYDTFFQQLVVSHAISSSLFFPTVSFDQAQKLQKKYLKSNDHIDMIGTRLLMETKAQRMILSMHKLSTAPDLMEEKESDRLDQVDRLVEELIEWMHRDHARREQYLQHLAGTLAQQCTHLEQLNQDTSSCVMMKNETQWVLALRHDIIQLFEHHLPTVTLPPSPVMSPSHSLSTHSRTSSLSSSLSESTDRTSITVDHHSHQNRVFELQHLIQLLDRHLASQVATEKQLNETLAAQMSRLQEKWDLEVERNQALMDVLEEQKHHHDNHHPDVDRLVLALEEEKQRTQLLETRLGNHRQEQEEDQDKMDALEAELQQEKQKVEAMRRANDELQHAVDDKDQLLQSQAAQQRGWMERYLDDGALTIDMALARLCKERDDARTELGEWQFKAQQAQQGLDRQEQTQAQQLEAQAEWQDKIHSLETQLGDWQAKAQEQEQAHARHLEAEGVWLVKIQTLETELGEWQAKAQHAQQTMEAERSAWQQQTQDLETQLQATTRTIEALRNDQSASAQQVEALEQQLLAHEAHLADSQQQIKALQQQPTEDWRQKYLDLETRLETAQQQFTHRESGYLLQSASVEAELEQILKEYDRLTRHIVDFNAERKKYEAQISDMQQHQHRLDQQLADLKVQCLGDSQGTTMTLRKEFRQLMAQTKTDHQQQLETEQQLRLVMEQERRDEKQEWERLRWDRVNVSVQTHFVV